MFIQKIATYTKLPTQFTINFSSYKKFWEKRDQ